MKEKPLFKQRLQKGEAVFGIWCIIPSGVVMNIIASAGFDFVIIDMEHGPAGFQAVEEMVRAAQSEGVSPLIRIGQINEEYILKALDIGAEGILTAHIGSKEEAFEAVSLSKYHPLGKRGFSPYTRAGGYSGGDIVRHCGLQNDRSVAGVLVEGASGVANFEDILSTPNLDLVYVGAYDLSQSLGVPGQVEHPQVRQTMETCMAKARSKGIAAGGYVAKNLDDIRWMLGIGMQFITYLPDCALFHSACKAAVAHFESATVR
jgi:4-hydroxy-2-oxoheptanedioate aldolase